MSDERVLQLRELIREILGGEIILHGRSEQSKDTRILKAEMIKLLLMECVYSIDQLKAEKKSLEVQKDSHSGSVGTVQDGMDQLRQAYLELSAKIPEIQKWSEGKGWFDAQTYLEKASTDHPLEQMRVSASWLAGMRDEAFRLGYKEEKKDETVGSQTS